MNNDPKVELSKISNTLDTVTKPITLPDPTPKPNLDERNKQNEQLPNNRT